MYPPNPYGWLTGPTQVAGRTRRTAIWITAWVNYGRPVIMDTRQVPSFGYDSKRRITIQVDEQWRRRYAGSDPLPDDALLVMMHPVMYRNLLQTVAGVDRFVTGPEIAAAIIDDVCRLHGPDLAQRMDWKVLGVILNDDDFVK